MSPRSPDHEEYCFLTATGADVHAPLSNDVDGLSELQIFGTARACCPWLTSCYGSSRTGGVVSFLHLMSCHSFIAKVRSRSAFG